MVGHSGIKSLTRLLRTREEPILLTDGNWLDWLDWLDWPDRIFHRIVIDWQHAIGCHRLCDGST